MSGDDRRLEQAAKWHLKLADGDAAVGLSDWLEADPRNRAAFEAVRVGYDTLARASADHRLERSKEQALAAPERARRRARNGRVVGALAAALTIGGVGLAVADRNGWLSRQQDAPDLLVLQTTPAQHRQFTLSDGSVVTLDGDSRVTVNFQQNLRQMTLVAGQARFQVAHNAARPFTVTAGDRRVVATGTDFNVTRMSRYFSVALISGGVKVARLCAPNDRSCQGAVIRLAPGEQIEGVTGKSEVVRTRRDPLEELAWLSGRLVARDMPLGLVAEHLSRNSAIRVTVSPDVAQLRISGVFDLNKPDEVVSALSELLPVAARKTGEGIRIVAAN